MLLLHISKIEESFQLEVCFEPRSAKARYPVHIRVLYTHSYSILAASAVPPGFVDGKVATEKVLAALNMGDNYRIGHTKVFFKAGTLGQLEELREEKLTIIVANLQARIRGYVMRKSYSKLQDQRSVRLL